MEKAVSYSLGLFFNQQSKLMHNLFFPLYSLSNWVLKKIHGTGHLDVLVWCGKLFSYIRNRRHIYHGTLVSHNAYHHRTHFSENSCCHGNLLLQFCFANQAWPKATGGRDQDQLERRDLRHLQPPKGVPPHLWLHSTQHIPELARLQVSRNLFRWTKEAKYADHYERLLINGIMGNQRGTQPGVMLYFLPMGPGRSKSVSGRPPSGLPPMNPGGWGGPNDTFWCCYGTGNSWAFTWLCSCSCWVLNLLVCIARDRVFLKARRFNLFPGGGWNARALHYPVHTEHFQLEIRRPHCQAAGQTSLLNGYLFWSFARHFCNGCFWISLSGSRDLQTALLDSRIRMVSTF